MGSQESGYLYDAFVGRKHPKEGLHYGEQYFPEVKLKLTDQTVEHELLEIQMLSPICLYSTDINTKKTYFYEPYEDAFADMVNDNFIRKYKACYGVVPESGISIESLGVSSRDKYVTRYKQFYLSGWMGSYKLSGRRKYLDFLYQTGLGSRNSQGFGMFEINSIL